mmetsp:Transcript_60023/g.123248  ORF Transcript_60023/g.123248 Transcript_60023/m.123248 type:complete len:214 (+) Transcript_60023:1917-2558(+)
MPVFGLQKMSRICTGAIGNGNNWKGRKVGYFYFEFALFCAMAASETGCRDRCEISKGSRALGSLVETQHDHKRIGEARSLTTVNLGVEFRMGGRMGGERASSSNYERVPRQNFVLKAGVGREMRGETGEIERSVCPERKESMVLEREVQGEQPILRIEQNQTERGSTAKGICSERALEFSNPGCTGGTLGGSGTISVETKMEDKTGGKHNGGM